MFKPFLNLNGCCDGKINIQPWKKCEKKETEPESIKTDFLIVGGGPGGILTAYKLAKTFPEKKVLILEQNSNTLSDYKLVHDDVNGWQNAQNDPNFQYSFTDANNKSVWMGKGLGGGSLHFGLQYIDQEGIVNKNYSNWKNYFEEVSNIINPDKYLYNTDGTKYLPNQAWYKLYDYINSNKNQETLLYNNKVYASKISQTLGNTVSSGKRLLLGNLIENMANVTVSYGKKIDKVNFNGNKAEYVETFGGDKYYGSKIILSAGAIQTPAILQRSEIDCGNTLFDHAAITVIYKKETTTITDVVDGYTNAELTSLGLNIYNINEGGDYDLKNKFLNDEKKKMHAIFRHTKLSTDDIKLAKNGEKVESQPTLDKGIYYVYDMGDFWNKTIFSILTGDHPGGTLWSRLINNNYNLTSTLLGQHGENSYNYRIMSNRASARLVGVLRSSKTTDLPDLGFEPSNIIGHLQTRDINYNWQTYYSTVASLPNWLILTHSQSTNLSGGGSVKLDKVDSSANPIVTLNHFKKSNESTDNDEYAQNILDAHNVNHELLTKQGYTLNSQPITLPYIKNAYNSIYHYHGTCKQDEVVDNNHKVLGKENLYLGDASVLSYPWAGSTSVPSAVAGYITALGIINELLKTE